MTEGGDDALQTRLARASAALAPAPGTADDDCFWLYSSGSTGRPKAAVHRHRDIVVTCVHYAVDTLGIGAYDVCFSAAKLFFAYGLGNAMTFPLWVGATAVLSDRRPSPQMTFDLIERFQPTLYFGVPTLYAAQLREMEQTPRDLSSVRLCISAGEALPPRHLPPLAGADGPDHSGWHRLHRAVARLHFQPPRRRQAGNQRPARAGLRGADPG